MSTISDLQNIYFCFVNTKENLNGVCHCLPLYIDKAYTESNIFGKGGFKFFFSMFLTLYIIKCVGGAVVRTSALQEGGSNFES